MEYERLETPKPKPVLIRNRVPQRRRSMFGRLPSVYMNRVPRPRQRVYPVFSDGSAQPMTTPTEAAAAVNAGLLVAVDLVAMAQEGPGTSPRARRSRSRRAPV